MAMEREAYDWYAQHQVLLKFVIRKQMRLTGVCRALTVDDHMATILDELPKLFERFDPSASTLESWLASNARYCVLRNITEWRKLYNKHFSIDEVNTLSDDDSLLDTSIEVPINFSETEKAERIAEVLRANMDAYDYDLLIKHDVVGLSFETMAIGHPRSRPSIQRDYLKALYKARRIVRDFEALQ